MESQLDQDIVSSAKSYVRRHLLFGWWSLAVFLTLGIALESLWALRVGAYVDQTYYMRRLVWTLGHAHGTLFALIHLIYALTIQCFPEPLARGRRMTSSCLIAASVLMPGGFILGGMFLHGRGGDAGMGIFLVPVGAVALLVAVIVTARNVTVGHLS